MKYSISTLKTVTNDPAVRKSFEEVLGKKSAGFISSIISAAAGNKYLAECEPVSIVRAAAIAAVLDLPINPNLGLAWLIPYDGVCTFQMGWKGFVQLAQRSGQYKTMNAAVVLEGQIKSRNTFTGSFELQEESTSQKVVGFIFYFQLLNGFEKYDYMSLAEVEAHAQQFSQSYRRKKGPWVEFFDAMALKTVTKRCLSKWGPLSIEMQHAIKFDNAEILDLEKAESQFRYPDNSVTPESSAAVLAEKQELQASYIPGLAPAQTCEQFFEATKNNLPLLETMISGLEAAGHKAHADKLMGLYKANAEVGK